MLSGDSPALWRNVSRSGPVQRSPGSMREIIFNRAFAPCFRLYPFRTVKFRLVERDFHLGIAARLGGVHGGHNPFDVATQSGPLLIADDHERDFPALEVLLVTRVFVGCQQKLETCGLGGPQVPLTCKFLTIRGVTPNYLFQAHHLSGRRTGMTS